MSAAGGGGVAPPAVAGGAGELCSLGNLLEVLLERSHQKLTRLVHALPTQPEETRREELLRYLHCYRQQLLRLVTLVSWLRKRPESANALGQARLLLDKASRHQAIFQETADKFFFLWRDELEVCRAPVYDVSTALEVLSTGHYSQLPTCIEELRGVGEVTPGDKAKAVRRMDMLLRCCLLDAEIPPGLAILSTRGGQTNLRAEGKYEVGLTLVPAPAPTLSQSNSEGVRETAADEATGAVKVEDGKAEKGGVEVEAMDTNVKGEEVRGSDVEEETEQRWRWCIVSVKMLPGSHHRQQLTTRQSAQLREVIQAKMWEAAELVERESGAGCLLDNGSRPIFSAPLLRMHQLLGDIAARLLVDNIVSTARTLSAPGANWESLIKVDPLTAPRSGVLLTYWPEACTLLASSAPGGEKTAAPALEVVLQDGDVTVAHVPELKDPSTGLPASVELDPLYADAERVLLSAAVANAHAQLQLLLSAFHSTENQVQLKVSGIAVEFLFTTGRGQKGEASSGDPMAGLALPSVQMSVGGIPMLRVHFQLKTGRLVLRAGSGLGGEGGVDVVNVLKQEEARIHAIQANPAEAQRVAAQIRRASASGAAPTPSQPQAQAQPVVEIIAARMLNFFKRIAYRDILTQLMVVSRPLLLQYMPSVPRHLSDACKAAASGTPSYYLAFPPIPLPTGFPIHRVARKIPGHDSANASLQGGDAPGVSSSSHSARMQQPVSLRFHLGVEAPRMQPGSEAGSGGSGSEAARTAATLSRFSLFISSATLPGLAIEAIRRVNVPPSVITLLQRVAPSVQLGKRKRLQEAIQTVCEGDGQGEGEGEDGGEGDATESAITSLNWGREFMEELAGVVEWCQQQIVWEQLKAQLDALQVKYEEEVVLGAGGAQGVPESGRTVGLPTHRRLNLQGDSASWQPGERAVVEVLPNSALINGQWRLSLVNPYLAGLPGSLSGQQGEVALLPGGAAGEREQSRSREGWVLGYSLAEGHSAVETLMDVERVMQVSAITRSIVALLSTRNQKKDAMPPPHAVMSRAATLPVSGTANGDSVLSAAIKAEEEAAKGSASKETAERQAVDVWAPYGQLRLSGVGLLEFELEWRPPLPSEHVITPAVPTTLRVNFRFAYKDATEGRAGDRAEEREFRLPSVVCRVSSEPALIQGVLDTLGEMVAAGEEGLMLDALRSVAAPLIAVADAISPARLDHAGLRPWEVVAHAGSSPYSLFLLVRPHSGTAHYRLHVRCYATGLVWVGLNPSPPTLPLPSSSDAVSHAPVVQPLPHLPQLLASLSKINAAMVAQGRHHAGVNYNNNAERPALWTNAALLGATLNMLFIHMVANTPNPNAP